MAGKKPTPVKPASPSASSPKNRPKQASAAGAKAPSPVKPRKNSKEKLAPAKKKRDKSEPEAGAKRKKQQASSEAGKPKKKAKKQQKQPGKSATSAKKQQSSGKVEKPAAAATTPTKKQQKEVAKREKQQVPGGTRKSTPTKRKRGDAEPPKEARSPKGASGKREAGAPTPVKKKHKDIKEAVTDMGTCSFPMARVRQLMRAEDDTIRASSEAVFLINKASELFLKKFADDAYRNALKDRKKSIIYDNLSTTVCSQKGFKFLSDFVPQRVRAEDALKAAAGTGSPS